MWFVEDNHSTSKPTRYRAPSWSWASVNTCPHGIQVQGPPEFPHQIHHIVDIIDVQVEPFGEDNTGQLKSGFIKFRGLLLPYSFFETGSADDINQSNVQLQKSITRSSIPKAPGERWFYEFRTRFDFYEDEGRIRRFQYLPLYLDFLPTPLVYGLILRPTHAERNEFMRIGSFTLDLKSASGFYKLLEEGMKTEIGRYRIITVV
jgi:hypothetical protein